MWSGEERQVEDEVYKGTEFDSSDAHEGAVSCVWEGTGSANKSSWSANNHAVCVSERDFV